MCSNETQQVSNMQVVDQHTNNTIPPVENSDDGETGPTVSEILRPFFTLARHASGRCVACMARITESESSKQVHEVASDIRAHDYCIDWISEEINEESNKLCSICDDFIAPKDMVEVDCICRGSFHFNCALEFIRKRNNKIIRYGFFVSILSLTISN